MPPPGSDSLSAPGTNERKRRRPSYTDFVARVRVPTGFLLALVYLVFSQPSPAGFMVGAAVALGGILLRAMSSGFVAKNERLATAGPYAYVRHPLYLGSALAGMGFCIAGGRWWFFALLAVFLVAVYWPVVRREEEHLSRLFPAEYAAYVDAVPALLPRLTRRRTRAAPPAKFDWKLFRQNREYQALLAFIGISLFLLGKIMFLSNN